MEMYDKVLKVVGPKKLKLAHAQEALARTQKQLLEKTTELSDLNVKLARLKEELARSTEKQQQLQAQVCTGS